MQLHLEIFYSMGQFGIKKSKRIKIKHLIILNQWFPLKKFGSINDIYEMCEFIINNKSQFTSGSTYILDGAQTKNFKKL